MVLALRQSSDQDADHAALRGIDSKRSNLIWLFGVGPLWTLWLQMGMVGSPGLYSLPTASAVDRTYSMLVYGLFAMQWLVVALFGGKIVQLQERRGLVIGAAILSAATMLLLRSAQDGSIGRSWMFPALFLLGAALVPLFLAWVDLYGVLGSRLTSISISGSLLLCALLYWAVNYLALSVSANAGMALLMFLPLASCASVLLSANAFPARSAAEKSAPGPRHRMPAPIIVLVGAYGIALGLMLGFLFYSPRLGSQANYAQAISVGIVALALLCSILFSRGWNLNRNYWPILPLVAAGFLLLPILHVDQRYLALDVALAGWAICRVLMVTICSEIASRLSVPASSIFGWDRFANDAGVAVGLLAQVAIARALPQSDSYVPIITLVIVVALVLVNSVLFRETRVQSLWGLAKETPATQTRAAASPLDAQCAIVAAAHQLTPREAEIMAMLAMGRNTDYIRKTLCVSSNTVRVHTTHIYSKLGVHSRQDLIDLVQKCD